MTIQEAIEKFIEYKKPICKVSTIGNYRAMLRKMTETTVNPSDNIEEVNSQYIQQVYDRSKSLGLSEKTARDHITLLKNVYNSAAALGIVDERMLKVSYSKAGYERGEKLKIYRKEELSRIMSWLELNPHSWTLGVYISIFTGARIGEVCGIKWEDVDFGEKTIHVQRTIERGVAEGGKGTMVYVNTTKTRSSNRYLPISQPIEKRLKDWSRVSRPEFYVTSNSLEPIEPRVLRDRFVRACKAANVTYKGFHSLRHTFATMMLENGADIKTISDILGHSSVEITMDVYSHPSDDVKRKSVNKTFRNLRFE